MVNWYEGVPSDYGWYICKLSDNLYETFEYTEDSVFPECIAWRKFKGCTTDDEGHLKEDTGKYIYCVYRDIKGDVHSEKLRVIYENKEYIYYKKYGDPMLGYCLKKWVKYNISEVSFDDHCFRDFVYRVPKNITSEELKEFERLVKIRKLSTLNEVDNKELTRLQRSINELRAKIDKRNEKINSLKNHEVTSEVNNG